MLNNPGQAPGWLAGACFLLIEAVREGAGRREPSGLGCDFLGLLLGQFASFLTTMESTLIPNLLALPLVAGQ
jgi:hypothetical protein